MTVKGISMARIAGILRENDLPPYMGMDRVADGVHMRKDPGSSGFVHITVHDSDEDIIVRTAEQIWDCLRGKGYVLSGGRGDQRLSVIGRDVQFKSRQNGGTEKTS